MRKQTTMPLTLVINIEHIKYKGDACMITGIGGRLQLLICCPGCGKQSTSRGKHVYNPKTQTYHPSIVHDPNFGGCGWHGWLINGVFEWTEH